MFVVDIRPESNEVVLGTREELQGKTFRAKDINLMKYASLPDGFEVNAKIRYRNRGAQASVYHENDLLRVEFHEGMDSITPGQSTVLYEGTDVVGEELSSKYKHLSLEKENRTLSSLTYYNPST